MLVCFAHHVLFLSRRKRGKQFSLVKIHMTRDVVSLYIYIYTHVYIYIIPLLNMGKSKHWVGIGCNKGLGVNGGGGGLSKIPKHHEESG